MARSVVPLALVGDARGAAAAFVPAVGATFLTKIMTGGRSTIPAIGLSGLVAVLAEFLAIGACLAAGEVVATRRFEGALRRFAFFVTGALAPVIGWGQAVTVRALAEGQLPWLVAGELPEQLLVASVAGLSLGVGLAAAGPLRRSWPWVAAIASSCFWVFFFVSARRAGNKPVDELVGVLPVLWFLVGGLLGLYALGLYWSRPLAAAVLRRLRGGDDGHRSG
jgi:hypothetical protein